MIEALIKEKGSVAEGLGLDPNSEEYKKIDPDGLLKNMGDLTYDQWRLSLSPERLKKIRDGAKGRNKDTELRYEYLDEKYKDIPLDYFTKVRANFDEDLDKTLTKNVRNQGSKEVKSTMLPVVRDGFTKSFFGGSGARDFTGVTEEYLV